MRILLFLVLLFGVSVAAKAQNTTTRTIRLTDKSVVKDSAGTVYPYVIWGTLIQQGYEIKPVDASNPDTEFLIYKPTEAQLAEKLKMQEARIESMPKPRESAFFTTGQKLNLFKTTDINGKKLDLKNTEGKIIVINFWFINCSPCRKEIPDLNKLVDSFASNDKVLFVAIALDKKESIEPFLEKIPFKYTIVDNGRFITDRFSIRTYPTHVILDTEGKVYFHTTGLAPNTVYWLKKSINECLAKTSTTSASAESKGK